MTHSNKLTRVRIVQDSTPPDPRHDQCMACVISDLSVRGSLQSYVTNLIAKTKGFKVADMIAAAAHGDDEWREALQDSIENDDDLRAQWLEQLKPELIVKEFETGYRNEYRYIAHITPELCSVPGVKWEDAEAAMDADIEMFEQWVNGDVYGYMIEEADAPDDPDDPDNEPEWEQTDSCWGFYGSDPFENGMTDHVPKELHDMLRSAEVEYEY